MPNNVKEKTQTKTQETVQENVQPKTQPKPHTKRIEILDGLRGLSIVLMVFHHLFFDLVAAGVAPAWLFSNPVFDVLHYVFAGAFVALSGASCFLSRSNIKRGLMTLGCAAVVTGATYLFDYPVWFGILHLLGACMLCAGLLTSRNVWLKASGLALFVAAVCATEALSGGFSADWFPMIPWSVVFACGMVLGKYVIAPRRLPRWFLELRVPVLAAIGRKTLWIYMLHQPVLVGVTWLVVVARG